MTRETCFRIEPCHLESYPPELADLIVELISITTTLGSKLHPRTAAGLGELVAVMNCYYSNLIEGHNTRPRDIERALEDDLDANEGRRNLQLEARAHIRVQREIDAAFASGKLPEPASRAFVAWVHRAFYWNAPKELLLVSGPRGSFEMVPGRFRDDPRQDNVVGRHHPPSSERVAAFMEYFEGRYRLEPMGPARRIIATAAAHHRLNYIHPFPDGNGRVSRLVSHAMALHAGAGAHGLWSISRGLARGLESPGEYRRMMELGDSPRRGDLDGRGNLSRDALVELVTWFTSVAVDQVRFMSGLFDLVRLGERLREHIVRDLGMTEDCATLAEEVLRAGAVVRGDASRITRRPERTARQVLRRLLDAGLLTSATPKGPVTLRFSPTSADRLFPRLFPAELEG